MTDGILKNFQKGFTIIELLVSMGILAVIFAISTIVFSTLIPNTSQSTNTDVLISDIKAQQTQAMTDDSSYGVHFETASGSYTLFKGSDYTTGTGKFVVQLDPTVAIANVTFPGSQIIFSPGSGDIVSGSGSVTLTNTQTNKTTLINLNQHAATD